MPLESGIKICATIINYDHISDLGDKNEARGCIDPRVTRVFPSAAKVRVMISHVEGTIEAVTMWS